MKKQIIFLGTVVLATVIPVRIDAQWGTSTFQNTDISRDGNVGIGFLHTSPLSDKLTIDATGLNSIGTNGLNILTGSSGYALAVHNSGGKFAIWPDGAVSIGTTGYTAAKLNVSIGSTNGSSAFHIHNSTNNKLNFSVADDGATVIGENNMVSPARLGVNGKSSNGLNIETANGAGYAMAIHNVNATPNGVFAIWPNGGVTIGNTSISTAALNVNMSTSSNAFDVYDIGSNKTTFRVNTNGNTMMNGNVGIHCAPSSSIDLDIQNTGPAVMRLVAGGYNEAKIALTNGYLGYEFKNDNAGTGKICQGNGIDLLCFKGVGMPGSQTPQVWVGTKPTTSHTDFAFAVGGKLVTQEVVVTMNCTWADYVFSDNYKLPKLKDVERFYKANKHLPEIPSAEEVNRDGVNVLKMNELLLKKVEELTLYIVDLQKQIDTLNESSQND
jgi:hypothetical protein